VVGLVALKFDESDKSDSELKRMFVREDCRGHGVGLLLAEALLAHVRRNRMRRVTLIVTNSRKQAIKFYEKLGFKKLFSFKIVVGWIRFLPVIFTGIEDVKYELEIN
jgi:ribosomal protein S18 acetylase RimI-like enzyme